MARLNEPDRRILLGDNFADLEAQFEAESRKPVTPKEKREDINRRLTKANDRRFTAMSLFLTGVFMVWAAWYRANDFDVAGAVGYAAAFAGFGWYAWLVVNCRVLAKRMKDLEGQ